MKNRIVGIIFCGVLFLFIFTGERRAVARSKAVENPVIPMEQETPIPVADTAYQVYNSDINNAIPVSNLEELLSIRNDLSGSYYLTKDIDLEGIEWIPIGNGEDSPFRGSFDGRGHTISNFTISNVEEVSMLGFFGFSEGRIHQLRIQNARVNLVTKDSNLSVGVLVGQQKNGSITDCEILDSKMNIAANFVMSDSTIDIGGMCGTVVIDDMNSEMSQCASTVDMSLQLNTKTERKNVTSHSYIGGLFGCILAQKSELMGMESHGDIMLTQSANNIYANGNIMVGGVAGIANGCRLLACEVDQNTTFNGQNLGSMILYTGGLVGFASEVDIENCRTLGTLTVDIEKAKADPVRNVCIGGAAGIYSKGTIKNILATSIITVQFQKGRAYAGGLIGVRLNQNEVTIDAKSCQMDGTVKMNCSKDSFSGVYVGADVVNTNPDSY